MTAKVFILAASLSLSLTSLGDVNACKSFYGNRTKISFFTEQIGKGGADISPDNAAKIKRLILQNNEISRLRQEIDALETQSRDIEKQINREKKARSVWKTFSKSDPHNIKIARLEQTLAPITESLNQKKADISKKGKAYKKERQDLIELFQRDGTNDRIKLTMRRHLNRAILKPELVTIEETLNFDIDSHSKYYQYYNVKTNLHGTEVTVRTIVRTGFRLNKNGQVELYSYLTLSNSKPDALVRIALEERFKRFSVFDSNGKPYNRGESIEQKFKRLGFDTSKKNIQDLIATIKAKRVTDAKIAARAEQILDAARQRNEDGLTDSQSHFMLYYFYYLTSSNSLHAYFLPSHWIIYHLEHSTPEQHTILSHSFTKAAELSNEISMPMTVESFDDILKMNSSDILGVREALDSDTYKQELLSTGIAETLGISEQRLDQMDSAKADDPVFSGGSEAEIKTETQQGTGNDPVSTYESSAPDTSYSDPTPSAPSE